MDAGAKMILGVILILSVAYVLVSIWFPEIIVAMNMTPIKIRWDAF